MTPFYALLIFLTLLTGLLAAGVVRGNVLLRKRPPNRHTTTDKDPK